MATLFSVWTTDNQYLGSCNAKCYNAKGERTRCICGGLNFGKGLKRAAENTLTLRWIYPHGSSRRIPVEDVIVRKHNALRTLAGQSLMPFLDPAANEDVNEQL